MKRRIGGAGGGSDKGGGGGKGAGTFLLAAGLALALGVGGTATIGTGALGSGTGSSASRGGSKVGTRNSDAVELRLAGQGIRLRARLTDDDGDCAAHAYGQVEAFLRANPCVGLHRALFELRDRNGDVVLLAIAWVEMPDESSARELHRLLDSDGSGNVTELSRERGRYRTVRYTGDFYASRRDGTVVGNAQAQPVARGPVGLALTSIATEAVR